LAKQAHEAADYNGPLCRLRLKNMPLDTRLADLGRWVDGLGEMAPGRIEPASADASFRRYFRVWRVDGRSCIAMDAPPGKEDLGTYLRVSGLLATCGVHVPEVIASDTTRGFALLEDLGVTSMLAALGRERNPQSLYDSALRMLARLQLAGEAPSRQLPVYDRPVLLREMQLLPAWYCERHLGLQLHQSEVSLLQVTCEFLVREALAQPQVFVHRDYHSRNLMITTSDSPGVIDFQDALRGPVGYDLASILKDCYIAWPRSQVTDWVEAFRQQLLSGGAYGAHLAGESAQQFLRWFDMIGLQRHLKVLGIFARLCWRDGKTGYLDDLPRTLEYVRAVTALYPQLQEFSAWTEARLAPGLADANQRARKERA
jgi:aminoglycoside/choline kinase family phosphotransferase